MPSSSDDIEVPPDAVAVATSYRRLERPISGAVALAVALVAVGAVLTLPFLWGLAAALAVFVVIRLPLFRTEGTTTLVTDADPGAVRAAFESACPPPLAFQWGIADDSEQTADGWTYHLSYLFGLRSTRVTVETRRSDDATDLELVVTAGGRSWATYDVTIGEDRDGRTTVEITVDSDRRFGLRRLPQWFVAQRYREAALDAQGYTVIERNAELSL